jgi:MutS2 family protein
VDERTFAALEYDKIRQRLAQHTQSGLGRERAMNLAPHSTPAAVRTAMTETTEARTILQAGGQVPLWGLGDLRPLLERSDKGGILGAGELSRLADCLRGCAELRRYMGSKRKHAPNLSLYAEGIMPLAELTEEIYLCTDGARVADRASPKLAKVRKDMRVTEERIRGRLQSFLTSPQYRDVLQESFITMRGDRYTLPVKANRRASFPGAVIDASGSGMTLYIEPAGIGKLTEEMRVLRAQEEAEEYQVLTALTGLVAEQAPAMASNLEIMALYDLAFAKGRMSLEMAAEPVSISEDGFIQLLSARHPLLTGEVVPVDLVIGERYRSLVITGPNTGGKTVVLKTAGLLTLMALAGLHIPVGEGSAVSAFRQVLADIGDSQSIEQSLSTFSGHISRIAEIMRKVDRTTLVLLDEIGTGTDPAEGAALAMAILEELHLSGCVTLASTHYGDVKRLADERPGFINGRMDFDVETLRPLYRLVTGEAGESQALWIADRLGLGPRVIGRAREHLDRPSGRCASAAQPPPHTKQPERRRSGEAGTVAPDAPPKPSPEPGGNRASARPWRLGDSVFVDTVGQQGVVAVLPDEDREMTVFSRGQRIRVHERRVKLIVGAERLYPEGYDLRTVLFTWQERQTMHDMNRKRDEVLRSSSGAAWVQTAPIAVDRAESNEPAVSHEPPRTRPEKQT